MSSVTTTVSPYISSLLFSNTPLTANQQEYLNQNYSITMPSDGSAWRGSFQMASETELSPIVPVYCKEVKISVATGATEPTGTGFSKIAQGPTQVYHVGPVQANTSAAGTASTYAPSKINTIADAAKFVSEAATRNDDFSLLDTFFNKTGAK